MLEPIQRSPETIAAMHAGWRPGEGTTSPILHAQLHDSVQPTGQVAATRATSTKQWCWTTRADVPQSPLPAGCSRIVECPAGAADDPELPDAGNPDPRRLHGPNPVNDQPATTAAATRGVQLCLID